MRRAYNFCKRKIKSIWLSAGWLKDTFKFAMAIILAASIMLGSWYLANKVGLLPGLQQNNPGSSTPNTSGTPQNNLNGTNPNTVGTPQPPLWVGNVLASFTGGVLALLGGYFASLFGRRVEKEKIERQQRVNQIECYRRYLILLKQTLTRRMLHNMYESANPLIADAIRITKEDKTKVLLDIPPMGSHSLIYDSDIQESVESAILGGIALLYSEKHESDKEFSEWKTQCNKILKELDYFERN